MLIDDETYEKELFSMALKEFNWDIELKHFTNGEDALTFLKDTKKTIFLIMSDMNMLRMSGLDLKKAIDADDRLKYKAIPFLFASNAATKKEVSEAYDYRVQGYFKKPVNLKETAEMLNIIVNYWTICIHPNNVKE